MRPTAFLLLLTLAAAAPMPQGSTDSGPPSTGDPLVIVDPSSMNPTTPPTSIAFPAPLTVATIAINDQPSQCDGQNPSEDCLNALAGGYIWYDKNAQCLDDEKTIISTALSHATSLAAYSSGFPNAGRVTHGPLSAGFYMGPDFADFQNRIGGNLKRISSFRNAENAREYITLSCQDTKNWCGKRFGGQGVGGYAWSAPWFGSYYHYITLCPLFFTADDMNAKFEMVQAELAHGVTTMATDMTWLRTTADLFLHEMMHTRLATGGAEPDIIDEYVDPQGAGALQKAYGPKWVHNLATRPLGSGQGGGATRSSTNADSYALLANAIWWWDTTTYFPGIPNLTNNPGSAQDPIFLHVDFENQTEVATADFDGLYSADLQALSDASDSGTTDSQAPSGDGESGSP